jgi:hypothetical protein
MGTLINTLFRTVLLDDGAFEEWRERPNLFARGIVLILVISLLVAVVTFVTNVYNMVKPAEMVVAEIDEGFNVAAEVMENIFLGMPGFGAMDPEAQEGMRMALQAYRESMPLYKNMVADIVQIQAPLPRGISGFLQALGLWLTGALSSIAGWMVYGAMVLVVVNLLGGSAKLPDFLGMVSLYAVPTLLGLLAALLRLFGSVPILGWLLGALAFLLGLAAIIWAVVVYIKAVAVASGLDTGRAILAVIAPPAVLFVLGLVLAVLFGFWIAFLAAVL